VPISYSIGSNLPNQEIIYVVKKIKELIKSLVENMLTIAENGINKIMNEYSYFIKEYCIRCLGMRKIKDGEKYEIKPEDLVLKSYNKNIILTYKCRSNFFLMQAEREVQKIKKWFPFPMIGFNNSFYDINICKEFDFMNQFKATSAIKQGSRHKTLSNDSIVILDQMAYCPQGTSLDKYLKTQKNRFYKG